MNFPCGGVLYVCLIVFWNVCAIRHFFPKYSTINNYGNSSSAIFNSFWDAGIAHSDPSSSPILTNSPLLSRQFHFV